MEDIEHLIEKPYKKRETRENKPERRDERRERDSRHRHSPYSREPPRNYYKEREERITENRSSVSHSRKSSNDRYSPSVPQPVLSDIERDARTVFVTQLALKLSKYELLDFFSKAGPVRDCTIVYDKVTGRSKGVGYVEFVDPLSVPEALLLNGHRLLGIPCSVQASGAEKNYKGDDHLAAVAIMSAVNPILPEYDHSFKKLYVGSIHYSISESDLISLFEPFGELESLKLQVDYDGKSKGYAFVEYKQHRFAQVALERLNGYLLGNLNLVIEISNEPTIELIEPVKDEPNPRSTALIRKSSTGELVKHTRVFVPVSQVPSACLLLKNVFNKTEEIEYDPINWMKLLELEIYNEVVKYGEVSRIIVDVDSESYVYVMFETIEACGDALDKLDGRFFAGRQISACYFQENTFLSKFGSLL